MASDTSQSMKHYARALLLAGAALILCADCTPTLRGSEEPLQPPSGLHVDHVPPIATALAQRVAPYAEVSPLHFAGWHPVKREMLITQRAGETAQLHRLTEPGGVLHPLTHNPDAVDHASYQPWRGSYLVYGSNANGGETRGIYRLNVNTHDAIALSEAPRSALCGEWSHAGDRLVATTVLPGKAGDPDGAATELYLLDPSQRETARPLVTLPGGGWDEFAWSLDDAHLVAIQNVTAQASRVWVIDTRSGGKMPLLPDNVGGKPVAYAHANFVRDGRGFLLTTDRAGEYRQLAYYNSAKHEFVHWTGALAADVDEVALSPDGKLVAITANEEGRGRLHLYSAATREELPLPALPAGSISELHWHGNNAELGFRVESARSAGDIYSLDVKTSRLELWASAATGKLDTTALREPERIAWKSFDGREISGYLYRPPPSFRGPRPVLISIHDGPQAQFRPGFLGLDNFLINELGIALIAPNIRGSSGFGKSFAALDDGGKREDALGDLNALLDWIAQQADFDNQRIAVAGTGYGGYLALAVATSYPKRIAATISIAGMANLASLLQRTPNDLRERYRAEYGDERDAKTRALLDRLAPLRTAHQIFRPILVAQGNNDTRASRTESEQLVTEVRRNLFPAWYLLADDEAQGFAKKSNAEFLFYAELRFLERYVLAK